MLEKQTRIYLFVEYLKTKSYALRMSLPGSFILLKSERKLSVLHAGIRNSCSDLKCDLFQNHLTDDKKYTYGHDNENALHYFFECNYYSHQRIIMFHQTRNFHPLSFNAVLFGKSFSL